MDLHLWLIMISSLHLPSILLSFYFSSQDDKFNRRNAQHAAEFKEIQWKGAPSCHWDIIEIIHSKNGSPADHFIKIAEININQSNVFFVSSTTP